MDQESMDLMRQFRDKHLKEMKGCKVLDIGSRIIPPGWSLVEVKSYRELFEEYVYTGMDVIAGRNVDIVGYERITDMYDVVISGQVMEHVCRPWEWLVNLYKYYTRFICMLKLVFIQWA